MGKRQSAMAHLGGKALKLILTGHRGYIGTVLVPMLIEQGHHVVGIDFDVFAGCNYGHYEDPAQTQIIKDVRDIGPEDISGADAILHLAGLSNDPLGDLNPSITDEINHKATVRLGRLAKDVGISRFVFSSSCSIYGAAGDGLVDESASFNPVTPYGQSKVDAELGLSKLADESFAPVFLRNATAYGLCPRIRFDLVVNNLTAWGYTTGSVRLKSDGMPWRPIVHIKDISLAFLAALNAPLEAVRNEAFNIGRTCENFRIWEIAEIVSSQLPEATVGFADDASPDLRTYRVNFEKAEKQLIGFAPKWTLDKGVRELIEGFERIGLQAEEYEAAKYSRIASIKARIQSGEVASDLRRSS